MLLEHAQLYLDRTLGLNFEGLKPARFLKRGPMDSLNGTLTCVPSATSPLAVTALSPSGPRNRPREAPDSLPWLLWANEVQPENSKHHEKQRP
jgi:hypothetical protein